MGNTVNERASGKTVQKSVKCKKGYGKNKKGKCVKVKKKKGKKVKAKGRRKVKGRGSGVKGRGVVGGVGGVR